MNYDLLLAKKKRYEEVRSLIPSETSTSYSEAFDIEYTHDSTAIEGNTLSLAETKLVVCEGISIGGKSLREIYEVVNHNAAFRYVKQRVSENKPLCEASVKDIHSILMANILTGGIYRSVDVYISGASHTPPSPNEMFNQIKQFYDDMNNSKLQDIELAAWTHAEFVRIHPFVDGNGRTARLIMNYQLMQHGWLPISISKEHRLEYINSLEEYATNRTLNPFMNTIAALEEREIDKHLALYENNKAAIIHTSNGKGRH